MLHSSHSKFCNHGNSFECMKCECIYFIFDTDRDDDNILSG